MTIYTAAGLSREARELRSKLKESSCITGELRQQMAELAEMLEGAAIGEVSEATLQAAVDAINHSFSLERQRQRLVGSGPLVHSLDLLGMKAQGLPC